ncbi:CBS domain-containing protein [Candidatus Bathycorpusculum sp.]|uniref:CBS domain-containing protein n=1 Tax=Candidatus Bathycorpusculum sp. TaxID=2994959 RepID=UPI002828DC00|nr:CBS domain-containing protein [Candidatus Termitimicrobium sp.]MCL2684905.1 CBS domain-containing protein [Candidatus Termitimicrobium sp.]
MLRVKDIMCRKVITAKEDISIQDAVQLLSDRHVGSIVVIDEEERCRGIFTERDAIRVFAAKYSPAEPLSKIMSSHVVTISLEASFEEAKRLMLSHNIRHLPVIDQTDKLIGMFSLRAFFDEVLGVKTPGLSAGS